MNAPVTRRALLGATAAVVAVALPAVVTAETGIPVSDPDADLFALLDRWCEASTAWRIINDGAFAGAYRAREATRPPLPEKLLWRHSDVLHDLGPARGHDGPAGARRRSFFDRTDVERLRRAPPLTMWHSPDSDTELTRVPDPEGQARCREIVAVHDQWATKCRAAEDACGYTRACEIEEATAEALNDAEDAVKLHQPRTLAGLARKALWVADLLAREAGDDDLAETFVRQVAAFGGLGAAKPRPGHPATFDAAAFLADLKAAGCKVRLEIPGTRFTEDELPTYFIAPSRGYTAVMAKWSSAIATCPDHVARVKARLAEMHGVEL